MYEGRVSNTPPKVIKPHCSMFLPYTPLHSIVTGKQLASSSDKLPLRCWYQIKAGGRQNILIPSLRKSHSCRVEALNCHQLQKPSSEILLKKTVLFLPSCRYILPLLSRLWMLLKITSKPYLLNSDATTGPKKEWMQSLLAVLNIPCHFLQNNGCRNYPPMRPYDNRPICAGHGDGN